jgi:hypothetical protein
VIDADDGPIPAPSNARFAALRSCMPAKATRSTARFIIPMPEQYAAIHFTDTLMLAGLTLSIGSIGDGLAETTIAARATLD